MAARPSKVFERADMLANGRGEVLRLHKAHILPARVTQDVTERVHAPPAFGRERDLVRRISPSVPAPLVRFRIADRRFRCVRPHGAQMFLDDAVAARESQPAQFFMQADRGQVRVAFQQLRDLIRIRVEQSRPARALALRLRQPAGAGAASARGTRFCGRYRNWRAIARCEAPE